MRSPAPRSRATPRRFAFWRTGTRRRRRRRRGCSRWPLSSTSPNRLLASDRRRPGIVALDLRWFIPVAEVKLCGHGTIAAAHFLFESGIVKGDMIEFVTKSGILTAKKAETLGQLNISNSFNNGACGAFSTELSFPLIEVHECDPKETPSLPCTLSGLSTINVQKTTDDLIVELSSGEELSNIQPNFDEIRKCSGSGLLITAPAPPGSGFDFFSRFFCPKLGINEDPVCGSAHCALAPYWSKKLGKHKLIAYMASPRGGRLDLQLEEETQRVRIKREAITVMIGTLLA